MFEALGIIGSGMHVHQTWMDAISDNIANINTVRPAGQPAFQARLRRGAVRRERRDGRGRRPSPASSSATPQGRLVFDPTNPMADAKGYVRLPDIDLAEQMTR